jgi:hypothetical protein
VDLFFFLRFGGNRGQQREVEEARTAVVRESVREKPDCA